jgi:glycosyltransferase involved in cell wall biosynthesis
MGDPLVSIIVPTHNRSVFLRAALNSLFAQDYQAKEVIVVDDGSLDQTATVCGDYPVRYFHQENRGVSASRNVGVRVCHGDLLLFHDDDDLCPSGSLRLRVAHCRSNPRCHHVVGRLRRFRAEIDGQIDFIDAEEPAYNFQNLGAGVLRRAAFEQVGGFNEALHLSEDLDLWMRLREADLRHKAIPDVCLFYRRHPGNCTSDTDNSKREFLSVLQRGMRRRKQRTFGLQK